MMRINLKGKLSTFGGPEDSGVAPDEGLALVDHNGIGSLSSYFLPEQPPGTTGLARRLNPSSFYIACRWDYAVTPKHILVQSLVTVKSTKDGRTSQAKPIDWGPNIETGRVADLSPGLAERLGLQTDDEVEVTLE